MYKCVLFDMDGTLVNSYEGIYRAYRQAFACLGLPFLGDAFVQTAIGAPLPFVFEHLCGMSRERAVQAIRCYREYYAKQGWRQVQVYDGMRETLGELKEAGCFLATATLKKETFAKQILQETGLLSLFDAVCGMDEDDRLTKADLIRRGMEAAGALPEETVLVGDSEFDLAGAGQAGIDFLAVTYGFGFRTPQARAQLNGRMQAESPRNIAARPRQASARV